MTTYTNFILTVIALALIGLLAHDIFAPTPAQAQYGAEFDDTRIVRAVNELWDNLYYYGVDVNVTNTVDVCETCQ